MKICFLSTAHPLSSTLHLCDDLYISVIIMHINNASTTRQPETSRIQYLSGPPTFLCITLKSWVCQNIYSESLYVITVDAGC